MLDPDIKQSRIVIVGDDKAFCKDVSIALNDAGFSKIVVSQKFELESKSKPDLLLFSFKVLNRDLMQKLDQFKSLSWTQRCPLICVANDDHRAFGQETISLFDDFIVFPRDIDRLGLTCRTLLSISKERSRLEAELAKKTQKADLALVLLKQAERKILQQNPELPEETKENNNIIADMSHELRTPLNAILGFSEIMKQERFGSLGHEKYLGYADDIHNASRHLLGIVNDVLDLAKTESSEENLVITEVSAQDAVNETLRLMALLAEESGIELSANIPDEFPDLKTDERRFKQVLTNLVSNAVKFTRRGGRVSVEGQYDVENGAVLMVIRDNGIGMSSEELALALSPYGQVLDAQTHTHIRGTGLGLPVSKRSIEALGGDFSITSEPGLGTAITLRFPSDLVVKK
ncbi:HAMP domain-containing sensor histidine kinase [Kiloniella sp. EL199]|uniref:sensor histidine kinase n=1 Tax=Kiloniella sp. EL199 TaxID=2107581 RepID=UPI000EA0E434|nr:HAMP domain-containing sensor histidine kinase [Kiloniella sp. EL199]